MVNESDSPSILAEKPSIEHDENIHNLSKEEQIRRIDAQATTTESFDGIDEKKVLRKMDLRLLPMLAILYLMSFLDRGNIGNAKIEGLTETLKMSGPQYNWCLTIFFFSYCAFEVPCNIIIKKVRPSRWLPSIMVAWGVVMTLMGVVQSYRGLLAARFFLGVTESGLYPGVAYYITMWYCRHEAQWRQALFFSAASIAGAFSGILAFGIAHMDGVGGLEGWRWIFILEGILTVIIAAIAFFVVQDYPETATFFSSSERAFVVHRLKYQGQVKTPDGTQVAQNDTFEWRFVRAAFKDWQIWANIFVYWGITCPLYGISLFLPTIVKELGYTSSTAQLMTVPVYVVAAALAILTAYVSDRVGKRSPFIFGFLCTMAIGFIMCISSTKAGVVYAGCFIAAASIYPAFPGNIVWLSSNLAGSSKRAVGMAIQIGVGNLAGAMASNFYRSKDSPHYRLGHALELGFIVGGLIATALLVLNYRRINRKRERQMNEGAHNGYTPEELSDLGDRALTFRYSI